MIRRRSILAATAATLAAPVILRAQTATKLSFYYPVAVGGPIVPDRLGFRVSAWVRRDGGYVDAVNYQTLADTDTLASKPNPPGPSSLAPPPSTPTPPSAPPPRRARPTTLTLAQYGATPHTASLHAGPVIAAPKPLPVDGAHVTPVGPSAQRSSRPSP